MEGNEIPPTPRGDAGGAGPEISPRSRKLKAASLVPSEQADPLRSRLLEVGNLKGRQPSTAWSGDEVQAFRAARLDTCSEDDFVAQVEVLRPYYSASIPREMDYRRRDLLTLLRHWPGEIDRAREFNRRNNDGIAKR